MGKKDNNNTKAYLVLVAVLVLIVLWTVGISYILATVTGLFIGQQVTNMQGFFILIVISLLATLFTGSE